MTTQTETRHLPEKMSFLQKLASFLLAIFALAAIKNFLDDDSGKLISDLGTDVLKDKKAMDQINSKIATANKEADNGIPTSDVFESDEVLINLDKVA